MTAPLIGAAGLVGAPGYTFNGATKTGFYLAGTNQIGWASNGVQGATFNADTSVTFAGTISAAKGTIPVGAIMDFAGSTAPSGWLLCYGQLVSTTTYAALFAVLSTTYGSGAGTFGIPDYRGRAGFGQDNMGGVAASRLTGAVSLNGTILGQTGGDQNFQTHTHTVNDSGHSHGVVDPNGIEGIALGIGGALGFAAGANAQRPVNGLATTAVVTGVSNQNAGTGSSGNVPPAIITNKIIFAGI